MKEIARTIYVQRLIDRQENGLVKIITGLRRAGKSYLLFKLYYDYLLASGVADDHIIRIALDDEKNKVLLDTKLLRSYIEEKMIDSSMYYLFLDEIQLGGGLKAFSMAWVECIISISTSPAAILGSSPPISSPSSGKEVMRCRSTPSLFPST